MLLYLVSGKIRPLEKPARAKKNFLKGLTDALPAGSTQIPGVAVFILPYF